MNLQRKVIHFFSLKFVFSNIQLLKNPINVHQIDLEKIIENKNPVLLRFLPRFVMNYIKKIIHQDELNSFLIETKDDYAYDFIQAAIRIFQLKIETVGLENIPEDGGCIVVCNHPLGGLDGIAVMHEVGRRRKDIKAIVNDLLMNLKNLSSLLIPVNKHGKNLVENIKRIDAEYSSDECIIVFPAGLVSRKQKGKVKDLVWQKSVVTKAIKYKQSIIPIYVEASNSKFFYSLASFRKKMGIKTNIEMFYLVDEVYKQKGQNIKLIVGKPISHDVFTKEFSHNEWTEKLKEHVYELSIEYNKEFNK